LFSCWRTPASSPNAVLFLRARGADGALARGEAPQRGSATEMRAYTTYRTQILELLTCFIISRDIGNFSDMRAAHKLTALFAGQNVIPGKLSTDPVASHRGRIEFSPALQCRELVELFAQSPVVYAI
jgi:hypothetical protein